MPSSGYKTAKINFSPLQNFQHRRYTLSVLRRVLLFWLCTTEKLETL